MWENRARYYCKRMIEKSKIMRKYFSQKSLYNWDAAFSFVLSFCLSLWFSIGQFLEVDRQHYTQTASKTIDLFRQIDCMNNSNYHTESRSLHSNCGPCQPYEKLSSSENVPRLFKQNNTKHVAFFAKLPKIFLRIIFHQMHGYCFSNLPVSLLLLIFVPFLLLLLLFVLFFFILLV